MKEEKAKEKGVAFKDVEDSSRPLGRNLLRIREKIREDQIKREKNWYKLTVEDGTEIHMLVETKYPLTKEILERMMSLKLIVESASDGAYDLLRFIQMKIDEAGSYDGGKKDL
ncbi:hypothetical protein Tco_0613667 [Tanacetum coccineum]